MTREEAIEHNKNLREYMRITDKKSEYKFLKENYEAIDMAIQTLSQEPCETCGYAEGSPFCLQYCPYDAERKKEQEPTVQDKQAESEKYQKAFDDGYANGYAQARFDYEQEPCEKCEVGNPCLYCKHKFSQKSESSDDAISREDVEECKELMTDINGDTVYAVRMSDLRQLPSITPSRHVDCEGAEYDGNGCLGYSHYGDDFPIEKCLHCPKYTSYEEE